MKIVSRHWLSAGPKAVQSAGPQATRSDHLIGVPGQHLPSHVQRPLVFGGQPGYLFELFKFLQVQW
jgi:hypothetical protein